MRRTGAGRAAFGLFSLFLTLLPAFAQDGKINTRVPPPPPPPEEVPIGRTSLPPDLVPAEPPAAAVPDRVALSQGTRISVVLATPLSTRISKKGQRVSFHTSHWVPLSDALELPPQTEFVGSVVEARRPGAFGQAGTLQVKLQRIELPGGASVPVTARLESPDANAKGRISADRASTAGVADLAQWAVMGTLAGWNFGGGKGAGYGAAAGAAVGLVILMSRRGQDLYLEPGMPFTVVLDREASLPGADVHAAQRQYARLNGPSGSQAGSGGGGSNASSPMGAEADPRVSPSERPKLKRRTKSPSP